jgi:propionate CoA-transferase
MTDPVLSLRDLTVGFKTPNGIVQAVRGIDLERDILQRLPFSPMAGVPREMDLRVFRNAPMRLREQMLDLRMEDRLSYDEAANTVYMNYAGLRVRDVADLNVIGAAVDKLPSSTTANNRHDFETIRKYFQIME